jgi:5-carboxymethyl-2-hydroxymuconate isomerase
MPHFVIEYSGNLESEIDWAGLVETVRQAAVETGVFPIGGIRVRTHRCDHWAIADGDPRHGFIAMVLDLGAGRDLAAKKRAGAHVFDAMSKALDPLFARRTVGLTFSIREIDAQLSWKRNNIHDALKPKV